MRVMTLWKLYRRVMALYAIVVALAALSGIGPGAIKSAPSAPPPPAPPPAVMPSPAPAAPAPAVKKVIGQCATGTDGKRWAATCVVDGQSYTLPGDWPTHAAALQRSVVYCRSEHGRAIHETQKPVYVTGLAISNSCPAGGVVLDPFAGSCTTLIAARALGRRSIGIELRENVCERVVRERLAQFAMVFG